MRVLGLDVGDRTIGVAVSDALKMMGDKFPMAAKLQLNQALTQIKK